MNLLNGQGYTTAAGLWLTTGGALENSIIDDADDSIHPVSFIKKKMYRRGMVKR